MKEIKGERPYIDESRVVPFEKHSLPIEAPDIIELAEEFYILLQLEELESNSNNKGKGALMTMLTSLIWHFWMTTKLGKEAHFSGLRNHAHWKVKCPENPFKFSRKIVKIIDLFEKHGYIEQVSKGYTKHKKCPISGITIKEKGSGKPTFWRVDNKLKRLLHPLVLSRAMVESGVCAI